MAENHRRGYCPTDSRDFGPAETARLQEALLDVAYLAQRGYHLSAILTLVGDRYQFSSRQRMALARACATREEQKLRATKEWQGSLTGSTLAIDGFNLIILLEAALSGSVILRGMDGVFRDLGGVYGTYRLIDKTDRALELIRTELQACGVAHAVFYLDAPVSNSGKLAGRIREVMPQLADPILVPNADPCLFGQEFVISGDGIVLDRCQSWFNLPKRILEKFPVEPQILDFFRSEETSPAARS